MAQSNAIQWEKHLNHQQLLPDHVQRTFERYFLGQFIATNYMARDALDLNGFITTLPKQQLDIFLQLTASYGKRRDGKTFIEILLHSIPRTNPLSKRPLLYAVHYIIQQHPPSRESVANNIAEIEAIANCNNGDVSGIARAVLATMNHAAPATIAPRYIFEKGEVFAFHQQLRIIISRANSSIYLLDNYADVSIFDIVYGAGNLTQLKSLRILCNSIAGGKKNSSQRISGMKSSGRLLMQEYPSIAIEIRSTKDVHDRWLLVDSEVWRLGPSIKDGGKKLTGIDQISDAAEAAHQRQLLENQWNIGLPVFK